jgi:regulator of sigma E protease
MSAVLLLVAGLAALSLAHESGHALAARALGLHVTDICVGLGPALVRFEWRGVRWMMAPIPLGGFVRVAEMAPESVNDQGDDRTWFTGKALAKRIAVIGAGPTANYLVAALVALALALGWGIETGRTVGLRVVSVDEGARFAGLLVGDSVVQVNGQGIDGLRSLSRALGESGADATAFVTVKRQGVPVELRMPRLRARNGAFGLGAAYSLEPESRQAGPVEALGHALIEPLRDARTFVVHAGNMLPPRQASGPRPAGIVGLADRVRSVKRWTARSALALGISLSVAMGLFNLLPFPGLDGGRLCIEAVQAARRRRLPPRTLFAMQVAGGLMLLAAWILLTAFEIYRW